MTSEDSEKEIPEDVSEELEAAEDVGLATDSDDAQTYFEQLATVKDSILEGVITYW